MCCCVHMCLHNKFNIFPKLVFKYKAKKAMAPAPVFLFEKPMDGGPWEVAVHGVALSQTRLEGLQSSSAVAALTFIQGWSLWAVHPGHPEKAWGSQHTLPLSSSQGPVFG